MQLDDQQRTSYELIGEALSPAIALYGSVRRCARVEWPTTSELAPYLIYFQTVADFLERLKALYDGDGLHVARLFSEHDKLLTSKWRIYDKKMKQANYEIDYTVKHLHPKIRLIRIRGARWLKRNIPLLKVLVSHEIDLAESFSRESADGVTKARNDFKVAAKQMKVERQNLMNKYGVGDPFWRFKDQLDKAHGAVKAAERKIASLQTQETYGKVAVIALGVVAVIALVAISGGTATAALPFISGMVITGASLLNSTSQIKAASKELDEARNNLIKVIESQASTRYKIFSVINSWIELIEFIDDGLRSASVALERFAQENKTRGLRMIGALYDVQDIIRTTPFITPQNINDITLKLNEVKSEWKFGEISRYLQLDEADSRFSCFSFEEPVVESPL